MWFQITPSFTELPGPTRDKSWSPVHYENQVVPIRLLPAITIRLLRIRRRNNDLLLIRTPAGFPVNRVDEVADLLLLSSAIIQSWNIVFPQPNSDFIGSSDSDAEL